MIDRQDELVAESEVSQPIEGEVLPPEGTGTDIVVAVTQNPGLVLVDTKKFDAFYESLKAQAPVNADVTTTKGRDALRSFAADVRSKKAAIDKDRLRLTKDWRDMIAQVNDAGNSIRERLEQLAVDIRKPLTDWEEADKARRDECQSIIDQLNAAAVVTIDDTSETVRARGMEVFSTVISPERFQELEAPAIEAKDRAIKILKEALDRLVKEEADRAELERLRAEEEARKAREQADREERERKEREEAEAKAAEEKRIAAEKAEAERIAQAERDAAEKAKREAEEAAQRKLDEERRQAEEKLAEERRAREAAEAKAAAEKKQREDEEAARKAEAERIEAERVKREADQAHRRAVMGEAKAAVMGCGTDEETARKIVLAIVAGNVPHTRMEF